MGYKTNPKDVVLVIRREKIKKLLLWVKLGFIGENTHFLATKIPETFLI